MAAGNDNGNELMAAVMTMVMNLWQQVMTM